MKFTYNITRGQLITLWIFGIIFFLYSIGVQSESNPPSWPIFLIIGIPGFLIYYTIGWRKYRKENQS
jgi:hypothetical protein